MDELYREILTLAELPVDEYDGQGIAYQVTVIWEGCLDAEWCVESFGLAKRQAETLMSALRYEQQEVPIDAIVSEVYLTPGEMDGILCVEPTGYMDDLKVTNGHERETVAAAETEPQVVLKRVAVAEPPAGRKLPEVGTLVVLSQAVERFPHFIAAAGMRGVVTHADQFSISVKMDALIPGCEEWDNEVIWTDNECEPCSGETLADVFWSQVTKLD